MAEGDDFNLDLSYMDENTGNANGQQQQQENGDYSNTNNIYDDSAELYGDESYDQSNTNGTNGDTKVKSDSSNSTATIKVEDNTTADNSGSRKRKDRDEDEEYSEPTAQNITPRITSATPTPSAHGGYGPQPTHALNIQQLGHNASEELIREWANAVGKEDQIDELKFDEFKPNGKSKGYVQGVAVYTEHRLM